MWANASRLHAAAICHLGKFNGTRRFPLILQYFQECSAPWVNYLGCILLDLSFPGGSDGKESACNAGDPGPLFGSGRSRKGNAYPLQYSCLENPMDRGACPVDPQGYTVHGVTKSQT